MKKIVALLVAGILVLSLISCTDKNKTDKPDKDDYIGDDVPKNEDGGIELPWVDVPLG